MNIRELYSKIKHDFEKNGTDDAAFCAKCIVCDALSITHTEFFMHGNDVISDAVSEKIMKLAQRKIQGEPLQYILGKWSFMGLDFYVDSGCLIPRQDTEVLTEKAIWAVREYKYKNALDMCCGSGCIGISIAKFTGIDVTLSDISEKALDITRRNIILNEVNAKTLQSDMFEKIDEKYDIITANPPYLTAEEMKVLQKEVTYEPENALFGGNDGLYFYRVIADKYKEYLNPCGMLLMEIGQSQGKSVKDMFENAHILQDLCKKDRVVVVRG